MARRVLLSCGILSSLLYLSMNIFIPMEWKGYDPVSQTVSELSAIGAPTRTHWVSLATVYSLLVIALGGGVWKSSDGNKYLRTTAILLIIDAVIGFFWPPMHQREVLAAGGKTLSDTLHIVFTLLTVPIMILIILFGMAALGKGFRLYALFSLLILVIAGIFTGMDAPKIESNLPTPYIGIWERISIGVYMLWVLVFSVILLRKDRKSIEEISKKNQ